MSAPAVDVPKIGLPGERSSNQIYSSNASNELVFAVVGHIGSGTTTIAQKLKDALEEAVPRFDVAILKASDAIKSWAGARGDAVPEGDIDRVIKLQDLGDAMRAGGDHAAVARSLIARIRGTRAEKLGVKAVEGEPVLPDGKRRAYILDSLRHPAEVALLSRVYGAGFALVGVVCREDVRLARVQAKLDSAGKGNAERLMQRDAKAPEKHGQRVLDTFHLSDYFLDNSVDRGKSPRHWDIPEQLSRLVKVVTHAQIVRPNARETAMYSAFAAQLRSACLSRQVGASLLSKTGEVLAVGTNEVPQAGGGLYGTAPDEQHEDHRCIKLGYCSNTRQQNSIIEQIVAAIRAAGGPPIDGLAVLRDTPVGRLLEFSRAVHAEMEALLSVGRTGSSTRGTRMFVTTFPCHYCARHLISAGVDEVAFIEPYPKSHALDLHGDAITMDPVDWKPPSEGGSKVLFRPFVGVAPRLYSRAFLKDRDLKADRSGGLRIGDPEWGSPWYMGKASYVELEAQLSKS